MTEIDQRSVGIDEVGRGAWAGPIVGAAVFFPKKITVPKTVRLIDSKLLTKKQKMCSGQFIREHAIFVIKSVSSKTMSQKCVQEANKKIFELCLAAMRKKLKNFDGISFFIDGVRPKNFFHDANFIPHGDRLHQAIASASIIAKVARDQMMVELAEQYPQYGFERHVGYGTQEHYEALLKHGPCEIHRRTFAPVKKIIADRLA